MDRTSGCKTHRATDLPHEQGSERRRGAKSGSSITGRGRLSALVMGRLPSSEVRAKGYRERERERIGLGRAGEPQLRRPAETDSDSDRAAHDQKRGTLPMRLSNPSAVALNMI